MDIARMKLGCLPPDASRFESVARAELYLDKQTLLETAQAPAALNWFRPPAWLGSVVCAPDNDPLGNDAKGDCVRAGLAHQLNRVFQLTGSSRRITTQDVLSEYDRATGGDDTGEVILDVLNEGLSVGLWGEKIAAVARVDFNSPDSVALGTFVGCGLYGGFDLPEVAREQISDGGDWDIPPGGLASGDYPGKWGRHAMDCAQVSPGLDIYETWGERQGATAQWRRECCRELYLIVWERWARADGRVPSGFDFERLVSDVRARGKI